MIFVIISHQFKKPKLQQLGKLKFKKKINKLKTLTSLKRIVFFFFVLLQIKMEYEKKKQMTRF